MISIFSILNDHKMGRLVQFHSMANIYEICNETLRWPIINHHASLVEPLQDSHMLIMG